MCVYTREEQALPINIPESKLTTVYARATNVPKFLGVPVSRPPPIAYVYIDVSRQKREGRGTGAALHLDFGRARLIAHVDLSAAKWFRPAAAWRRGELPKRAINDGTETNGQRWRESNKSNEERLVTHRSVAV